MIKNFFLPVLMVLAVGVANGQTSTLSFKAGISNCKTKTVQEPATNLIIAGFDDRIGGLIGGQYTYKVSRYFSIGIELLYLLKGNTSITPAEKTIYSNHYLSLSPVISFFPFVNSGNKYISCISPEVSFNFNYLVATNKDWRAFGNSKFYPNELGYSLNLTYQPGKYGVQLFYFRSISPFYKTQWGKPTVNDYKYSFVTGISIIYKIFSPHSKP
jgi:hypothetical protein